MKGLLIANPNAAGIRGPAHVTRVERRLRAHGLDVDRIGAAAPGEVAESLRRALENERPEDTRVVVVGGDGTIHAALPALAGTRFPLAIIPAGTLNALAGELGIPRDVDSAIALAATGRLRRIDLGLANGRPFAQMAGVGFDGAVVHSVVPAANKSFFEPATLMRGLRLLTSYSPSRLRVTANGEALQAEAWLALVANASRYSYCLRLSLGAQIDDGWLDMWVFGGGSAAQTAGQVISLLRGRQSGYPGVWHVRAREFRLECDPPVCLQLDGDAAGKTPAEIGILPQALTVVVPRRARGASRAPAAGLARMRADALG